MFSYIIKNIQYLSKNQEIQLYYKQNEFNQRIVKEGSLKQYFQKYQVISLLSNRHVETIFASRLRPIPLVTYNREIVKLEDGGIVALDWVVQDTVQNKQNINQDTPIVIILAGLGGGSQDSYVKLVAREAQKFGMAAVVFNLRGHGNCNLTTPSFFGKTYTSDTRDIVHLIRQRFPYNTLFLTGFSMGANILTNFLAKEDSAKTIEAAVAFCPPFQMSEGVDNLRKGFGWVYNYFLTNGIKRRVRDNIDILKAGQKQGLDYNLDGALNTNDLRTFDDKFTCKLLGFKDADEYYQNCSSGNFVQNVKVPILFINAQNDPIAVSSSIPSTKIQENDKTILALTPSGGHLGWISGENAYLGNIWGQELMFDYFVSCAEAKDRIQKVR